MPVTIQKAGNEYALGERPRAIHPRVEINADALEALSAMFATVVEMAGYFGLSKRQFLARLKEPKLADAYRSGRAKGRITLRRKQVEIATEGNSTMLRWLGVQYLGQSQKVRLVSPEEEAPDEAEDTVGVRWTPEMEAQLLAVADDFPDLIPDAGGS